MLAAATRKGKSDVQFWCARRAQVPQGASRGGLLRPRNPCRKKRDWSGNSAQTARATQSVSRDRGAASRAWQSFAKSSCFDDRYRAPLARPSKAGRTHRVLLPFYNFGQLLQSERSSSPRAQLSLCMLERRSGSHVK